MNIPSFLYGVISVMILLVLMAGFGFAHFGSIGNVSGKVITQNQVDSMEGHHGDSTPQSSESYSNIPENCRPPVGQDIQSWKEHLSHHQETKECLKYFN